MSTSLSRTGLVAAARLQSPSKRRTCRNIEEDEDEEEEEEEEGGVEGRGGRTRSRRKKSSTASPCQMTAAGGGAPCHPQGPAPVAVLDARHGMGH
jgi:hypothetical protein